MHDKSHTGESKWVKQKQVCCNTTYPTIMLKFYGTTKSLIVLLFVTKRKLLAIYQKRETFVKDSWPIFSSFSTFWLPWEYLLMSTLWPILFESMEFDLIKTVRTFMPTEPFQIDRQNITKYFHVAFSYNSLIFMIIFV